MSHLHLHLFKLCLQLKQHFALLGVCRIAGFFAQIVTGTGLTKYSLS